MRENICALVDLFDKAVAEGARPNTMKRCQNPATRHRNVDRYKHKEEPSHNSITLVGGAS